MKKRFRFKNKHLIAPKTYYLRAMQFWARDSLNSLKLLHEAERKIKLLELEISKLKNEGKTSKKENNYLQNSKDVI